MKEKLLVLFCFLAMLFFYTGCKKDKNSTTDDTNNTNNTPADPYASIVVSATQESFVLIRTATW